MPKISNESALRKAITAVCDTAGFYDTFEISAVLAWLPHIPGQTVRDAVRQLVREGALRALGDGFYGW